MRGTSILHRVMELGQKAKPGLKKCGGLTRNTQYCSGERNPASRHMRCGDFSLATRDFGRNLNIAIRVTSYGRQRLRVTELETRCCSFFPHFRQEVTSTLVPELQDGRI